MKYYLIAGEASGDLHASNLMQAIRAEDSHARFHFLGGDLMQQQAPGQKPLRHYREIAYMGILPVLLHAPTILRTLKTCQADIRACQPDAVILIDYPGFNLKIAKYVKTHLHIPVYYYIAPKLWAWKKYRIHTLRKYVDRLLCILPFEVTYYQKLNYPVDYVGNPTLDAITAYRTTQPTPSNPTSQPILAILAGSRKAEIKENLPTMLKVAAQFPHYQPIIAGAPGLTPDDYHQLIAPHLPASSPSPPEAASPTSEPASPSEEAASPSEVPASPTSEPASPSEEAASLSEVPTSPAQEPATPASEATKPGDDHPRPIQSNASGLKIVYGQTYELLDRASVAIVTSGTATLEAALFRTPQVVCYHVIGGRLSNLIFKTLFHIPYISLVNLIAGRKVVRELFAADFTVQNIHAELKRIIEDESYRHQMLKGYDQVITTLGSPGASARAAKLITTSLKATLRPPHPSTSPPSTAAFDSSRP
jgi:lipid A disaccharide synthetase